MKDTTLCFEKWCQRFDDVFTHKAQVVDFECYLIEIRVNYVY